MKISPKRPASALIADATKLGDAAHLAQLTAQDLGITNNERCAASKALDDLVRLTEAEAAKRYIAEVRATIRESE